MRLRTGVIGAMVALPLTIVPIAVACSSAPDGASAPAAPATTVHDMSTMGMGPTGMSGSPGAAPKVECAQHMPGDLLTAAEAMVIFDSEHVCLAYVTVTAGTAITWHNGDDVSRTVSVTDGNGTELMAFEVSAGGAATRSVDVAGVYRYRVSAIESFVGSIEVQVP